MLLFFVTLYLLATILIGFLASRRVHSSGDYMLAGRSLPMVLSTSALFATWFGSETVFGASSQFLEGGLYAVIEDPFGAVLCLLLFGMFFARKLYSMNLVTLGDFFKQRFDRKTELLASIFMVPSYFGYIAGQLVAMGLILNVVIGMEVWTGVVISAVVVTLYTFAGGMWAVSVTDFIQGIIIVIGLIVVAVVLANKAGGPSAVFDAVPASDFKFFPEPRTGDIVSWLAAWSVLGLGSLPSQDVFQRAMSSGSQRIAVRSCYYASGIYLVIAMLPLFICLCIKKLYPGHIDGDTQLTLPNIVIAHTAIPVQIFFFGSLLSAVMSTTSSSILAPAAIFSENIVRPLMKTAISDNALLRLTRISVIIFALIATIMACLRSNIYELVGESSILSLVSLFIPLTLGLYWRKANGHGAVISMIGGMVTWIIFEIFPAEIPSLVPSVGVSLAGMVLGSLFLKTKVHYDQDRTQEAE